jgi:hypothetical protein
MCGLNDPFPDDDKNIQGSVDDTENLNVLIDRPEILVYPL